MPNQLQEKFTELKRQLIEEDTRKRIQFLCIFFILAVLSMVMTIINIITKFEYLMWATLIFSFANMINVIFAIAKGRLEKIANFLFSIEIIALFTYFQLIGEPEGFSVLWSAMLPIGGMLLFGRKYGSILCTVEFLIIVFFFWLPFGKDILSKTVANGFMYSQSFMLRYPVLYISFFAVGLFFETIRTYIQRELALSRDRYKAMSYIDPMTGLGNENSYYKYAERCQKEIELGCAKYAVILMDLNYLKRTNDMYGHRQGSSLIIKTGEVIKEIFPNGDSCHVGGDEFVVILQHEQVNQIEEKITELKRRLSFGTTMFENLELILSVACGYEIYQPGDTYKDTFSRADKKMYENKEEIKKKYNF